MRCYIAPEAWRMRTDHAGPDETHHLLHVLRVRGRGSPRGSSTAAGRTADAAVTEVTRSRLTLEAGAERTPSDLVPDWCSCRPCPRRRRWSGSSRRATELGMLKPGAGGDAPRDGAPGRTRARQDAGAMVAVAIGATRQCGSAWAPEIEPVRKLQPLAQRRHVPEHLLFGDLAPGRGAVQAGPAGLAGRLPAIRRHGDRTGRGFRRRRAGDAAPGGSHAGRIRAHRPAHRNGGAVRPQCLAVRPGVSSGRPPKRERRPLTGGARLR